MLTNEEVRAVARFTPVSPELLASRDLLQRTDTKYLLHRARLPEVLENLQGDYRVLYSGREASAQYVTRYLDTPAFDFFHAHRRGKRIRFKVRMRHYLDRRLSYLEVKGKGPSGTTQKWRRSLTYLAPQLSPDDLQYVSERVPIATSSIEPVLEIRFRRITLVGVQLPERITLDIGLCFANDQGRCELRELLVAEVKQARFARGSPIMRALTRCHALAGSTSKYCVGTALLRPDLRHNRLLPTLARIERLSPC